MADSPYYRKRPAPIRLGRTHRLRVIKEVPFGVYLDAHRLGEILLPARYVPKRCRVGDELTVFLYLDSDDTPIATTLRPKVEVGQCAHLKAVEVNRIGAFLDWGLSKDLLVPYSEQRVPMQEGRAYTVYVYQDEQSGRIAASSKLSHFLPETDMDQHFRRGQQVELLLCTRTDLGLKAVIDGSHLGMLFKSDLIQPLKVGQRVKGFIKAVRPDGRIDLALQPVGRQAHDDLLEHILQHLEESGGTSTLTDKSSPEEIYRQYGVSKLNYKKALGRLYKLRRIELGQGRIRLLGSKHR